MSEKMNKKKLEDWTAITICGNATRAARSPLSTAIANELRESAGWNKPRTDYIQPLDNLIRDLQELRSALCTGEAPKGW